MAMFVIARKPESEVWRRVASVGPRTVSRMKSLGQRTGPGVAVRDLRGPKIFKRAKGWSLRSRGRGPAHCVRTASDCVELAFVSLSKQPETLLRS